jgi:Zn-dependent protease with chaperone function
MRVLILLSLLFPLAAGPLARAVTARVAPLPAPWLMTAGALLLAGTSCGALGLLVLSELVRMPTLARLGHWSSSIVAAGGLPGGWTSLAAGIVLGAALLAAGSFAVRRGRALADAGRHARDLPGRDRLVVTGDAAADAYAVPGRPGRIVVSAGMLDALDPAGRAALLAHERAHLSGRHHWFTGAARLAAAANPLVRPLAGAVEYTVERWADEAAAAAVGDRRLVATAIASAALASKATKPRRTVLASLGAVLSGQAFFSGATAAVRRRIPRRSADPLSAAGPVPRRVAALLAPAPRAGLPAVALSLAFLGGAALCAVGAADHLQDLISFAHASAQQR